ncbi:DUF6378 domain-containing protein [Campylobacter sp. MOP7]|uniref:DUF6378 domain-containing protein n=1 Tax=Campylobacter canis TaxID=3378588 RepID=UPI00387E85BE
MSVNKILEQREQTHGSFRTHAQTAQYIKVVMQSTEKWRGLNWQQREALEMITHKIARILSGKADYQDHWDDIAGYTTLVSRELGEKDTK